MARIPSIETKENLAPEHREVHDASGYYSMILCPQWLRAFILAQSGSFPDLQGRKGKKGEPPHGQPAFLSNLNEF